jgi:alginate O-acetyltransferase complex protein AlgI
MLFYTKEFILFFLPITLIFYYFAFRYNLCKKIILILLSLIFYSWWNIYYLPLIFFSILVNYSLGKKIKHTVIKKKIFLFVEIIFNILLLFSFKYIDFFIDNFNLLTNNNLNNLNLPFPLGISFYTFQIITYLVDCYYSEIKKNKFKDFFLFVIFFPQLIAGPIIKYNFFKNQIDSKKVNIFNIDNFIKGTFLFLIGYVKKVYLSNNLASYVDKSFENINELNTITAWLTSFSFTFQFYFDFSAYVDMALGCALMLNIILPINFNSPLKALNLIDFWKRWHITLTNFLMNYIYFPILTSRKNISFSFSMGVTLFIFLLAGFWHGPSWNFIFFGFLHGIAVIFNHIISKIIDYKMNKVLSIFLTINYVNITFIFFRSEDLSKGLDLLKKMLFDIDINNFKSLLMSDIMSNSSHYITFVISVFIIFFFRNSNEVNLDKILKTHDKKNI